MVRGGNTTPATPAAYCKRQLMPAIRWNTRSLTWTFPLFSIFYFLLPSHLLSILFSSIPARRYFLLAWNCGAKNLPVVRRRLCEDDEKMWIFSVLEHTATGWEKKNSTHAMPADATNANPQEDLLIPFNLIPFKAKIHKVPIFSTYFGRRARLPSRRPS